MHVKIFFSTDYQQLEQAMNDFVDSKIEDGKVATCGQIFRGQNAGQDGVYGTVVYSI